MRLKEFRLRRLFSSLLIALSVWANGSATCAAQTRAQESPLSLDATIIGQSYCAVNPKLSTLQLRLRLRYTNMGAQKIILYKGHDLFYQARIRRAASGSVVRPYEVLTVNSRYFDEQPERIEQRSPGKVFTVLSPGASYERELMIGVGVVGEEAARGNNMLVAGEHTLYLIVSTWYQSRNLALQLRQQWQRKGFLWADPLVSTPLAFTVERPATNAPCR
jgi:hypothetical protein